MKWKVKLGDLVEVAWEDAQGFYNEKLSDVKLASATNIGELVRYNRKTVTLRTGHYSDDGSGDFFIVPTGWITSMKAIRRK